MDGWVCASRLMMKAEVLPSVRLHFEPTLDSDTTQNKHERSRSRKIRNGVRLDWHVPRQSQGSFFFTRCSGNDGTDILWRCDSVPPTMQRMDGWKMVVERHWIQGIKITFLGYKKVGSAIRHLQA